MKWVYLPEHIGELIWHPKFSFAGALNVEKIQGFGSETNAPQFYYFLTNKRENYLELYDTFKITFSCKFNWSPYPFDVHYCRFSMKDKNYDQNYILLSPPKVYHESGHVFTYNKTLLYIKGRII